MRTSLLRVLVSCSSSLFAASRYFAWSRRLEAWADTVQQMSFPLPAHVRLVGNSRSRLAPRRVPAAVTALSGQEPMRSEHGSSRL